jgi:peptidoglycan/LPS O-acetylase OafA/YrhL
MISNSSQAYRPDIDGLRAIAGLAVIAFHASSGLAPRGFVGVDIFFVISGYLISSLIFKDLEKGRFRFTDFYTRRIKRILPAYIVVSLFTLAISTYLPHESPHFCATLKSPSLGFPRAAGPVTKMVQYLKGTSSRILLQEFAQLRKQPMSIVRAP